MANRKKTKIVLFDIKGLAFVIVVLGIIFVWGFVL